MATRKQIHGFRHFNRFYTGYLGLFGQALYKGQPVNLTEARVLYELDAGPGTSARELQERLRLDKGYLSRLLKRFKKENWIEETPSEADGRVKELRLTETGNALMTILHRDAESQADAALNRLCPEDRKHLLDAMATIEALLGEKRS